MSDKKKISAPERTSVAVSKLVFEIAPQDMEAYAKLVAESMLDPTKPEPAPEVLLSHKGVPVLWRTGKAFVCGVAKSRKTTLLTLLASFVVAPEKANDEFVAKKCSVLYVDTEQARYDSQKIVTRVSQLTGIPPTELPIDVLNLNTFSYEDARKMIEIALRLKKYDVLILDNWTDCVKSVMDDVDCPNFTQKLRDLAQTYNIATLSVIHANESARDDKTLRFRGWGSEEARKSDLTMCLYDKGDYSEVRFDRCRNVRPEPFAVRHDANGLPCIIELIETPKSANPDRYARVISQMPQTGMTYTDLTKLITTAEGNAPSTAKRWVTAMLTSGTITQKDSLYYPSEKPSSEPDLTLPF